MLYNVLNQLSYIPKTIINGYVKTSSYEQIIVRLRPIHSKMQCIKTVSILLVQKEKKNKDEEKEKALFV